MQTESQETLSKSQAKANIHHLSEIAFHNTLCTLTTLTLTRFLLIIDDVKKL